MSDTNDTSRRGFMGWVGRGVGTVAIGGVIGAMIRDNARQAWADMHASTEDRAKMQRGGTVWQIDPLKCIACGKCATSCVLNPSAVRCVHAYAMCGYCNICTGYLDPNRTNVDTAAESQVCPTGAIPRSYVEDPNYEYAIDRNLCIGCAKCVKGCRAYGNGSLYLQIDQDACVKCNACSIAAVCPSQAISRVPAREPYKATKVRGT